MAEPTIAYIGLGSNLGDRRQTIERAVAALGRNADIEVTRRSELRETPPLGNVSQGRYLNGVCEIRTTLGPAELLGVLRVTEDALGRTRESRWMSRTIDLDLLLFGQAVVRTSELTVPHAQMHLRSFVLDGLSRLAPEIVHPVLGEPVRVLAERLNGADFALDPGVPQLVSVAGIIGVGKTTLANKLAGLLGTSLLREPYDTNPFMPEVYAGREELALDSELYFLVNRAEQLARDTLGAGGIFVTDYVFEKELIYAQRLLNDQQLKLHERIYRAFVDRVAAPVLVIYLTDSPEECLTRIHRRNRPYEQKITVDFLARLHSDYEQLFADWRICPVMRVPAGELIRGGDAAVERLVGQVRAYIATEERAAVTAVCENRTDGNSKDNR
ncbi:MAG: 2-amino-4-hydroxy-6-hydroxymethyldihydropteridine diphosphokinase [Sedimentisphaerales bacterium]|nr:2-amino-4-hydroxy-6-hydroxymethyldihydropteridine diphosphokinase [Sedimentisphaerales bacterium]